MSQERRRAREARQAERAAEVAAAAARRQRAARRQALRDRLVLPRRRRRYGALPARVLWQLAAAFLVAQAVTWWLLDGTGPRFSVAVLSAAVLLVTAKTRRSTPR